MFLSSCHWPQQFRKTFSVSTLSAEAQLSHKLETNILTLISIFAAYIYDAVMLWALGVNKTLEQGYSPEDGYRVTDNIFNSTFEGMSGPVIIDNVGDRRKDTRYRSKSIICNY